MSMLSPVRGHTRSNGVVVHEQWLQPVWAFRPRTRLSRGAGFAVAVLAAALLFIHLIGPSVEARTPGGHDIASSTPPAVTVVAESDRSVEPPPVHTAHDPEGHLHSEGGGHGHTAGPCGGFLPGGHGHMPTTAPVRVSAPLVPPESSAPDFRGAGAVADRAPPDPVRELQVIRV